MVLTDKIQVKNSDFSQVRQKKIKEIFSCFPLYGITASQYYPNGNIALVQTMIQHGFRVIQYRDKTLSRSKKKKELKEISEITRRAGTVLIINDHVDLCIEFDADGVHLGQEDMPVEEARALLGEEKVIGLSTHTPEQGSNAVQTSADYIGVGPIYPSITKPNEPAAGLDYARFAATSLSIPMVGLGGITEKNCPEVRSLGITTICIINDLLSTEKLENKITNIKKIFS